MLAIAGCASAPADSSIAGALVERSRVTMGSEVRITAWTTDAAAAAQAFEAVFDDFDRLDAAMSVWKEESDIVRLNRAAGEHPVPVGDDVRSALRTAQQIGQWTNGKFDVTFAALADIWKFDHDQDNRQPLQAEIDRRLPLVDYAALVIDDAAGTAFLKRRGMRAHLGGIPDAVVSRGGAPGRDRVGGGQTHRGDHHGSADIGHDLLTVLRSDHAE